MSDLDNILNGVDATSEPEPQEEPKAVAEPEATPEPEVKAKEPEQSPEEKQEPANIPYAVFKSQREDLNGKFEDAKKEAEYWRQQAMQKPAEPEPVPDIFEDQQGFVGTISKQMEGMVTQQKLGMSKFFAERDFGKDEVAQAIEFFNNPAHSQRSHEFMSEPSPFHAAVEYVRQQKVAAEIGNDPAAYRESLKAELMKEIQAEMAAKQVTDAAQAKAPSMANVNGSGGQTDPGWSGPASLESLIG